MTRKEAADLYGWLKASYPRNYRDVDARTMATTIDNLSKVFAQDQYIKVQAEYERIYGLQKNEPHPSEVKANLKGDAAERRKIATADPDEVYKALKKHPKYAEIENAYGARATRRAAKLCVVTGTVNELMFHLQYDTPCREGSFLWMLDGPLPKPYH